MTIESSFVSKLLINNKKDTIDNQNDKKLNAGKPHSSLKACLGNFKIQRTTNAELFILIIACSLVPLAVSNTLDYYGSQVGLQHESLFILGIVTFAALLLSIIITRSVTRPIAKIIETVEDISKGKLGSEVLPTGNSELVNLARSINSMSQKLKKQHEELSQKEKRLSSIGELSARISHDLRNPLFLIKTSISVLKQRNGNLDAKTQNDFARLERAISKMTNQIDEVLDFVNPKPLDVKDTSLLKVLSSTMERLTIPDKIKIYFPQEDVHLRCDPEKMEVVFTNLVSNAMQAMRNEGSIFVRAGQVDQTVNIEVEDTGPGIPYNILPKLFEPLFTTRQVGTGLGLVSCKRIVEKHGGTIEAKNSTTGTALFVIRIPKNG